VRPTTIDQKLVYAILTTKRKLLYYFESHPIRVVTSCGLGEIVRNYLSTGRIAKWALELMGLDITYVPQTTIKSQGRIAKWALELMGLDITYVPQTVIKSQVLMDFVAKWTETQHTPSHPRALEHVF
jgi:hypothetical protein